VTGHVVMLLLLLLLASCFWYIPNGGVIDGPIENSINAAQP